MDCTSSHCRNLRGSRYELTYRTLFIILEKSYIAVYLSPKIDLLPKGKVAIYLKNRIKKIGQRKKKKPIKCLF